MRISRIFEFEFHPEKPWSQRRLNSHRIELINNIRNILNVFAGNDLTNLLRDLIRQDELKTVASKYYNAIGRLSKPINEVKLKNKHYFFRELKLARLKRPELIDFGFKIGRGLWSSCKRTHQRLHGGREPITTATVEQVTTTLEKLSSFSSYKTVQARKRKFRKSLSVFEPRKKVIKYNEKIDTSKSMEAVCNMEVSVIEAKKVFDKKQAITNQTQISLSSFSNILKKTKKFKKPHNVSCETLF